VTGNKHQLCFQNWKKKPPVEASVIPSRVSEANSAMSLINNKQLIPSLCFLLLLFTGCGNDKKQTIKETRTVTKELFTDQTEAKGLSFIQRAGDTSDYFMPRSLGSGVGVLDYDQDGLLDLYCLQNAGPGSGILNRLFQQQADGTFKDVSKDSGLAIDDHSMGVTIGDFTNDGYPEVLLLGFKSTRLFLNIEGKRFREITETTGIDNPSWATSGSLLDIDRDGWLDLVIANYIEYAPSVDCSSKDGRREFCGPDGFSPAVTRIYRNTGSTSSKTPVFEDVTISSGLARHPGPGLGVACFDFNGDHWVDIFVADDAKANRLFINQKNGTFAEEGIQRGIALDAMGQTRANMGVGFGDIDNDGMFDLFVTHLATERHTLWRQGPRGVFADLTSSFGLNNSTWRGTGFGAVMGDFDRNGLLDIAFVNGDIRADRGQLHQDNAILPPFWRPYAQKNQLFLNQGQGRFRDASESNPTFCDTWNVGRGLAKADLNNDGCMDLVVSSIEGPLRLLMGNPQKGSHWLTIRAVDPSRGNRDDYGAEVSVTAGNRLWRRWLNPGAGYMCSNDPRLHFGLGGTKEIDSIQVLWSDGRKEHFPGTPANRMITLERGKGTMSPP
jgi:hypothetical protein